MRICKLNFISEHKKKEIEKGKKTCGEIMRTKYNKPIQKWPNPPPSPKKNKILF